LIVKHGAGAELTGTLDYRNGLTTHSYENFVGEMGEHSKGAGGDLMELWPIREWSPKDLGLREQSDNNPVSLQEFEECTIPSAVGFSNTLSNPQSSTLVSGPNHVGLSAYFNPQLSYSQGSLQPAASMTAPWTYYQPANHDISHGYYTPPTSRSTSIVPIADLVTGLPPPHNSTLSIPISPAVSQADIFAKIQVLVVQEVLKTRLQSFYT